MPPLLVPAPTKHEDGGVQDHALALKHELLGDLVGGVVLVLLLQGARKTGRGMPGREDGWVGWQEDGRHTGHPVRKQLPATRQQHIPYMQGPGGASGTAAGPHLILVLLVLLLILLLLLLLVLRRRRRGRRRGLLLHKGRGGGRRGASASEHDAYGRVNRR